jgi:hypothetical protein
MTPRERKREMNTKNTTTYTLTCRLREFVITDEGDFIPAGTPVKVMGWTGNDTNGDGAGGDAKVEVRASAYMYADTFDYDTGTSAVGRGLYFSVEPGNLVFDAMTANPNRYL